MFKKRSDKKRVTKIAVVTKNDFGVGSARWPDGPPQSGVAHGFGLIPVSGVGDARRQDKQVIRELRNPQDGHP